MTLQDIQELKYKIQQQKDILVEKGLFVDVICEGIEILEELEAHRGLIKIWYECNKKEIEPILKELQKL